MRKFAQITKLDNKVVNIFDWTEEINPDLGEQNLLLDITKFTGEIHIGDIYDGKGFSAPQVEEEIKAEKPEKEKTVKEINELIAQIQEKINKL